MRTWFITGISRGFGLALAQAVLDHGDTVIGTVRQGQPALTAPEGKLHVLTADLADPAAVGPLVAQAFARVPRIDVLVNNAGYGLLGALEDSTEEETARLFAVNVCAPIRLMRAVLPRMRAAGAGHIINITSIAGHAPMAGSTLYGATKFALEGLSHALAPEVAPFGIRVTAIAPGAFRTDFLDPHSIRHSGTERTGPYAETVGRLFARFDEMAGQQAGDPARAAQAILTLVTAEAPPVHILLGTDALTRKRAALEAEIAEIDAWEAVTRSTDFPKAG